MIAALLGVGIGFAIGAGSSNTTKTQTVTHPGQTVTHASAGSSVSKAATTVVRTVTAPSAATKTVTQTVRAAAPSVNGARGGTGGGRTFRGNGAQSLGTITVRSDSTLYWQCASCTSTAIKITSEVNADGNAINVMSRLTSGRSSIAHDVYKNLRVNAPGQYTITIR